MRAIHWSLVLLSFSSFAEEAVDPRILDLVKQYSRPRFEIVCYSQVFNRPAWKEEKTEPTVVIVTLDVDEVKGSVAFEKKGGAAEFSMVDDAEQSGFQSLNQTYTLTEKESELEFCYYDTLGNISGNQKLEFNREKDKKHPHHSEVWTYYITNGSRGPNYDDYLLFFDRTTENGKTTVTGRRVLSPSSRRQWAKELDLTCPVFKLR